MGIFPVSWDALPGTQCILSGLAHHHVTPSTCTPTLLLPLSSYTDLFSLWASSRALTTLPGLWCPLTTVGKRSPFSMRA